jgi:predicted alpha/beta hydrolase
MEIFKRPYVHLLILTFGIILMLMGFVKGKMGAALVGLLIAAVNFHRWNKWKKEHASED